MPSVVKTTINLPEREIQALKRLAERRSVSLTHLVRQAAQTELFVQGLVDGGSKLLVQGPEGQMRHVVFAQTDKPAGSSTAGRQ